jgi:hypothetical protein
VVDETIDQLNAAARRLEALLASLRQNSSDVSDEDLVQAVDDFAIHYFSGADGVAYSHFCYVAPICSRRPHLEDRLLEYPAWGLFGMFSRGDQAVAWIRARLDPSGGAGFAVSPAERDWLGSLVDQPERFQAIFDRFTNEAEMAKNKPEE